MWRGSRRIAQLGGQPRRSVPALDETTSHLTKLQKTAASHWLQHRCCHADPITQGRDTQWPEFAVGFRYPHSSDRIRLVILFSESLRQFAEPPLHSVRFDIRKVLSVYARCALVRAALSVGVKQNIFPVNLVVQSVEVVVSFRLRFRV